MKITIYELLGLVKDGKAPKKIMYNNIIWEYIELENDYRSRHNAELFFNDEINNTWIMTHLNTQIEILEEKKIPEKLKIEQDTSRSNFQYYIKNEFGIKMYLNKHTKMIADTLNQVIDYLESKGE